MAEQLYYISVLRHTFLLTREVKGWLFVINYLYDLDTYCKLCSSAERNRMYSFSCQSWLWCHSNYLYSCYTTYTLNLGHYAFELICTIVVVHGRAGNCHTLL